MRILINLGLDKEIKHLPEVLQDNEIICYLTSGLIEGNTWLIVCTNKRVIFLDKGLLYGLEQLEISLDKINSISQKRGLMLGEIAIWDGARRIRTKNVRKDTLKPFVDATNKAIEAMKNATINNVSTGRGTEDVAAQIEKLADLHNKNILTDEEFQAKKKQLLGL
ncbi:PH domain-containing protein [Olavius algarvensis spirochete endosymbiont]|uniref:PH domain-containing protein n=1 Tax=Olavius algarvensis spirochete endosymbiont TaxID=260710 RepID=UPI001E2A23EF|nr:PH domain-containing protein [Olavius algarvensis spirochete endosymbiont]